MTPPGKSSPSSPQVRDPSFEFCAPLAELGRDLPPVARGPLLSLVILKPTSLSCQMSQDSFLGCGTNASCLGVPLGIRPDSS